MIGSVEFDSEGKACRLIRVCSEPGILDVLATGHRLNQIDVNWCKRDETYYLNESGAWTGRIYLAQICFGVRHKLVAHETMTFSEASGGGEMISAARIKELGYDLVYSSDPIDWNQGKSASHRSCYYCEPCDDMLPDREQCDHVYWCDDCGVLLNKKTEPCPHYCDQHELQLSHCGWDH